MSDDVTARLHALWAHLGLKAAHVAAQMPFDIEGVVAEAPDALASLTLLAPLSLNPPRLHDISARVTLMGGDSGTLARVIESGAPHLPGSRTVVMRDYACEAWTDCVAERTAEVVAAFSCLSGPATVPVGLGQAGDHAGISYRVSGSGPALVLLPMLLAPSQWDPAIEELATRFTVITLGGQHLGGVAFLEGRAASLNYQRMVRDMFDNLGAGERILEVGCGTGVLARQAAQHFGPGTVITAMDINPFLLREAAALAREDGLGERIVFREGNAEQLPFADGSFDHAYSVTVLEEVDADRVLAELRRVVKPGGRVAVIVRAIDGTAFFNIDVPDAIRAKAAPPAQWRGPKGIADRSLYARMAKVGFTDLDCAHVLVSYADHGTALWQTTMGLVLSRLTSEEQVVWQSGLEASRSEGVLFRSAPHHVAVGRVPR